MVQGAWSRKFLWFGWVLVAAACGPEPICVTGLGVEILGMVGTHAPIEAAGYSCEDFNTVEAEIGSLVPDSEVTNIDWTRVRGYQVTVHAGGKFTDFWGRKVAGWSFCPSKQIQIGIYDPHVARSAYTHELLHAAQGCYSPPPIDEGLDGDHANWHRDNLYNATNKVAGMH